MRVLIQKLSNNDFPNINFFQANEGFKLLGWTIEYFQFDNKYTTPISPIGSSHHDTILDKETVVVGGVSVIDYVYKQLGVTNPYLTSYPQVLAPWLRREVKLEKMHEFRKKFSNDGIPGFIKPIDANRKLFTGYVVKSFKDLIHSASVPDNQLIHTVEVVEFVSEYRAFIHNNEIVGLKHYKGDFLEFPATGVIWQMIEAYKPFAPVAYSLDIGVILENYTSHDKAKQRYSTALVEVNDSNALGCYGLAPTIYAKMIADRWEEVMK